MAGCLIAAGHDVSVFDLDQGAVARVAGSGATAAGSLRDIAERCEIVFLSLPSPRAVETVIGGQGGLAGGTAVRYVVDLSTIGAYASKKAAQTLADAGKEFIDAPVSGGVSGAAAGTLAVMASGRQEAFDVVKPVLAALGKIFYVGSEAGLGQSMKLVNNYLSATALIATAEAVVIGMRQGLDPALIIDVLNAGSGRNSATVDKFPRSILPGTFNFGFAIELMCKDLGLFLNEAEVAGVDAPIGRVIGQSWTEAREALGDGSDFTEVIVPMARKADVVPAHWAIDA